jgi:tetratricopeptide (TPR) repeat protein
MTLLNIKIYALSYSAPSIYLIGMTRVAPAGASGLAPAGHGPLAIRDFWPLGGLWLLAFLLRGLYLWQIHGTPQFSLLLGDAKIYDAWATQIAAGDWLGTDVFYQAPLYPYFLGLLYTVFGHHLLVVRVVQAVLGATSCVFLAAAGRRFFSRPAGLLAGLLLAVYPYAIYFDGLIQKSSLDLFLLSLLLWLFSLIKDQPRPAACVANGFVLGLLALSRENALLLACAVAPWLWLHFSSEPARRRLLWLGLFLLGLTVVLLPVAARNAAVGGQWQLTTAQFGPNFYIGNHDNASGLYIPLVPGHSDPVFERDDATRLAEASEGRSLTPAEVSSFWTRQSLAYIRDHPAAWLHLLARKSFLLFNAFEISDSEDPYTYADSSFLLRNLVCVFHFGALLPVATIGLVLTWSRRRDLWLLHLSLLLYAASVVLFYVFARYRFPLVAWLILFAAAGIFEIIHLLRVHRPRPILLALIVAAFATILANWPVFSENDTRGITAFNIARHLAQQPGRTVKAIAFYRQSLSYLPAFPEAHRGLGLSLVTQGDTPAATAEFLAALKLNPYYADAAASLGDLLAAQGNLTAAASDYQNALRLDPTLVSAHGGLANVLFQQGQLAPAITEYEAALRLDPDNPELHYDLANAFASGRQFDAAILHYRAAISLQPGFALAHYNLGNVYALRSAWSPAIAQYQEALQAQPNFVAAHHNLANTFAAEGQPDLALVEYRAAVHLQPGDPNLASQLARFLITSPSISPQEVAEALDLASRACDITRHTDPEMLATYAMTLALAGHFPEAADIARQASTLATVQGNDSLAAALESQINLYEHGRPYRP